MRDGVFDQLRPSPPASRDALEERRDPRTGPAYAPEAPAESRRCVASLKAAQNDIDAERAIANFEGPMIPVSGRVGGKIRGLTFYELLGRRKTSTRILNFARCNYRCPFCFRAAHRQRNGVVLGSEMKTVQRLATIVDNAIGRGQMFKLSGGDPCAEPEVSLCLARLARRRGGRVGIAHNGSHQRFCRLISPYLEMAAIDIKAVPAHFERVVGLRIRDPYTLYEASLENTSYLTKAGIVTDVRTPVFADTSIAGGFDHDVCRCLGKHQ